MQIFQADFFFVFFKIYPVVQPYSTAIANPILVMQPTIFFKDEWSEMQTTHTQRPFLDPINQ